MSRPARWVLVLAGLMTALFVGVGLAPGAAASSVPASSVSASSGFATSTGALSGVSGAAAPTASGSGASVLPAAPVDPNGPSGPSGAGTKNRNEVDVRLRGIADKPSTSVSVILAITLLSLLPAILLTCTCFTKILVVLSLTRNALGLQQTPPNQVLAGLALFLSLFIMSPVLSTMNKDGVQPYMDGTKTSAQAFDSGIKPLKSFMLDNTDDHELELLTNVAKRDLPKDRKDVGMDTLVPAFILSELKDAFTIGFIVFLPFLVIDIVVSGALMALGMMMMPPVMVSLPFKLLLFVMVDGWGLIIKSLVASYG